MRFTWVVSALTLLVLTGCSSGTSLGTDDSAQQTQPTDTAQEPNNSPELSIAQFSGATFVSTNPTLPGIVSFTDDTATWENADIVEVASYSNTGEQQLAAVFSDREVVFESDGSNLIWDSVSYLRATSSSQFDSQESMELYFDGRTYNTIEQFDIGEGPSGELAMGNWSIRFNGNEVSWSVQDTVAIGTVTYIDNTRFKVDLGNTDFTVVLLDNDRFIINSIEYQRDVSNQFDSQEELLAFFDGAIYESVSLQELGRPTAESVALGYWSISFSNNSFTWVYLDIAEAGTISFSGVNSFNAILTDREIEIIVEGNDILWDGQRYTRK